MKRSPELEALSAADETAVSNRNTGRNQTIGMAALLLGALSLPISCLPRQEKSRVTSRIATKNFRRPPSGRRHSCVSRKSQSRK